jgi:transcriptional regulator with XRE-family HTH domain
MPTRERLSTIGAARGRRLVGEFADELRRARLAAGLTQSAVGSAVGLSKATISRIERGQPPLPDFVTAARVASMVGLELSIRCFPAAGQLRDIAHIGLIQRFLRRVPPTVHRQLEAPVRPGDLRAWDLLLTLGATSIGVAAETRIRDLQALLRREHRKLADGGVEHLLLLVADTRHNRSALHEAGPVLREALPLGTRFLLTQIGRGEAPTSNGIVLL